METCRSLRKREVPAKRWERHKEANLLPLTEGLLCAKQCWILRSYCEPQEVTELSLKTKTYLWDTRGQNPLSKAITLKYDAILSLPRGRRRNTAIPWWQYVQSPRHGWAIFNPAIHLLRICLAQIIRRALESSDENWFTAVSREARSLEKLDVTVILQQGDC